MKTSIAEKQGLIAVEFSSDKGVVVDVQDRQTNVTILSDGKEEKHTFPHQSTLHLRARIIELEEAIGVSVPLILGSFIKITDSEIDKEFAIRCSCARGKGNGQMNMLDYIPPEQWKELFIMCSIALMALLLIVPTHKGKE